MSVSSACNSAAYVSHSPDEFLYNGQGEIDEAVAIPGLVVSELKPCAWQWREYTDTLGSGKLATHRPFTGPPEVITESL